MPYRISGKYGFLVHALSPSSEIVDNVCVGRVLFDGRGQINCHELKSANKAWKAEQKNIYIYNMHSNSMD